MEMIQQQPMTKRKKVVISVIAVAVCCTWALLALYSVLGGKQDSSVYAPQGVYRTQQAPAPAVGGGVSFYTGSRRSASLMYRNAAPATTYTVTPHAPAMRSTSSAQVPRVYLTSNASMHSYGGSGSGGASSATYSHRSSNNSGGGSGVSGVSYASYAYAGSIYVPSKHNAVTAVGASEAEDVMAQRFGAPRRAKNELPNPNPDPEPSEEEPTPVGSTPWLMMLLLAGAYALRVALRKKNDELCTIVTK